MKVLILGSGGREHALAWKLSRSSKVDSIIVCPGNPGMEITPKVSTDNLSWKEKDNFIKRIEQLNPDYVVIGPEDPLANGVADWLREKKIPVVGPSAAAAKLESSKIFAKNFMQKYDIPTASFKTVGSVEEGYTYLESLPMEKGIVVKADALAGGKGVVVTDKLDLAKSAVYDFLDNKDCSISTKEILFEEMLRGKELSAFALCDGTNYVTLGYACDYKRVFDNDLGPNTGGMGGYQPQGWPSESVKRKIDEVFRKTLLGMEKEGNTFNGFLFVGLMIENEEINVIEYNVRMGDPETQILMPTLNIDLHDYLKKVANHSLNESIDISSKQKSCVHIVLTSGGYPSIDKTPLNTNNPISYPVEYNDPTDGSIHLFFAGVNRNNKNELVNSGGRVMGVSAVGSTTEEAKELAYSQIKNFNFKGMHYRQDIARI
ncbi:MAG: phosphoribosylamine--glycine ligase [Halobacteriovorax sp.]|nr:phosphoribosylamine--glycine ligase [Halobacteriovorax sp.]|tara:strand:- start:7008 stop:8300 length:1293 start_codon:yes stop_codon:yes gene_type:complete